MSSNPPGTGASKYLLLTLVVFFLACIPNLLNRSIWTDEVYTMLLLSGQMLTSYPDTVTTPEATQQFLHSSAPVSQMLQSLVEDDVHPPVYFLIAKAWASVFGQTLFSLRWLSVAAGLATIFVFAHFLALSSPALARVVTPIFAASTGALHYSTEVRHYIFSLLGLVVTLYVMGRIIAARTHRSDTHPALIAALVAATSLTLLTNYLAIFPIAACYLWFVVLRANWRTGLVSGACSLLLFSLWLPFLFQSRPDIAAQADGFNALSLELYSFDYHPGQIGWEGLPRQLYLVLQGTFGSLFIASHIDYPNALHWIGRIFLAGLIVLGATSTIARTDTDDTDRLGWLFVLLALAPAAGAILLYFVVTKQLYGLRYMMLAVPGLAALCGMGILRFYRVDAKLGVATGIAAIALLLSVANWGYTSSFFQGKTIYRALAASVQQQPPGSSLVIAGTGPMPGNTTALFYELPPSAHVLVLRPDSDIRSVLAAAQPYDHIWLIRVRELTRSIEDALAATMARTWEKQETLEQIEHYAKLPTKRDFAR